MRAAGVTGDPGFGRRIGKEARGAGLREGAAVTQRRELSSARAHTTPCMTRHSDWASPGLLKGPVSGQGRIPRRWG